MRDKSKVIIYSDANPPIVLNATGLVKSRLSGMDLHRAILTGLDLRYSKLVKTELRSADLHYADMSNCDLSGARLTFAECIGAILRNANLTNCLANANTLVAVDFTNANLLNTNFVGSNLHGAILLSRNIETANFETAKFDDKTIWPSGFDPIKHGAIKEPQMFPEKYTKEELIQFAKMHIEDLKRFYNGDDSN